MDWHIEHIAACASTQEEAKARARDGARDGTVVVAPSMTRGRGQHDRAWHAPEGGWYASIVLRDLGEAGPDPRLLTLALGNAIADVMEVAGADARLKWVNDVLVDDRKIAGILVEAESTGSEFDFLVAGIGINLNGDTADWPDGLAKTATTLEAALGADTCIEDTEPYFLDAIGEWIDKWRAGRREDILSAWRARDALSGKTVRIGETTGTAQGIDDAGRLLVDGTAHDIGPVTTA